MGRWQLKSIRNTITGYKYTFTFDGAEDVLVVKFANEQDIKQWDIDLHSKTLRSRGYPGKILFRAEELQHGWEPKFVM